MKDEYDNLVVEKLKEAFETVLSDDISLEMPKEALKKGTIVKSLTHNRTGVVADAFYGDLDQDNQKIIIYTILLLPDNGFGSSSYGKLAPDKIYFTNEYEYDIIGFLMVPPLDIDGLLNKTKAGLTL